MMGYDLHSEFDIEQHRKTFINYLEILIEPDGHVVYALPSHQEKAIELAMRSRGMTRKEIYEACPPEYYFDFLPWLLGLSGSVSVWNRMCVGDPNEKQIMKLKELKEAGLYKGEMLYGNR